MPLARAPGWLALGGVLVSGILSVLLAAAPAMLPPPPPGSAAAQFVQQMLSHHLQAVAMARQIAPRTADPALLALAVTIRDTQSREVKQLRALLQAWQLPGTGSGVSRHHAATMGMALADEVQRLSHLPLPDAERLFLQLMIRHHQGAMQMARPYQGWFTRPEVRGLASHVGSTQRGELEQLKALLARRGGVPLPPPPAVNSLHH